MSAERTRRAVVTEAQGKREADITVAEGEKQAAILKAEGDKQSNILKAEGQRASQVLVAEGFATALDKIYETAKTVDEKTMALQYLEVLKAVGTSPSTKYIFPLETLKFLEPLAQMAGTAMQPK
jgi:regulator of protease activity HflC (stomatin/prohibitin superfamily)